MTLFLVLYCLCEFVVYCCCWLLVGLWVCGYSLGLWLCLRAVGPGFEGLGLGLCFPGFWVYVLAVVVGGLCCFVGLLFVDGG